MLPLLPTALSKISLRTILEIIGGVVLVALLAFQTVRIEGVKIWPIHVKGFIEKLDESRQQTKDVQDAFDKTVAAYRLKAAEIKTKDEANLRRVEAEAAANSQEREDALRSRIDAARAHAARLQRDAEARANSGGESGPAMSGLSFASGESNQTASEGGLSFADRLIATEQAIQLDELIKWVHQTHNIRVNLEESENVETTDNRSPSG